MMIVVGCAWLAVGSLEEMPDVVAIYCEHHDDVLPELVGGMCDALQIKTQASGLENSYGDRFRHCRLASISGFHLAGNAGCLH